MSSYATLDAFRRISGARIGTPSFSWAREDMDSYDRAEEREKARKVLDGTERFSSDELQRILARLVLNG